MPSTATVIPFRHEVPDGRPDLVRLDDLIEKVTAYNPDADILLLQKAYVFSAKAHKGQVRVSGEPYLMHPLKVAGILTQLRLDVASVAGGLLHDTVEDTLASPEEIKDLFGAEVAGLVEGVTKISKMKFASTAEAQAENIRKMMIAMSRDIRILLIKLADRLHNMQTLEALRPDKQARIAQETLDIYAPLANRLGISWMKTMLEDLSLRAMHPESWDEIDRRMRERAAVDAQFIEEIRLSLAALLSEQGIPAQVVGRAKHHFSIYKKMESQRISFEQIHDLLAFRIILDDIESCYRVLGQIHARWKPVPGRIKDFIAMPKANGYQSLHTTVIGPRGERVEIQIRTHEMNRIAEEGIAAHWKYKEGIYQHHPDEDKVVWLRQLVALGETAGDAGEYMEAIRVDLYDDEVFVFTPKGEVKRLPSGATALDFAYSIHSEVGNRTVGALVDSRMVPLRYRLKNGERIEILTSPNQTPAKDWLKFAATAKARQHIRTYLRQKERVEGIAIGHELLEKALRQKQLELNREIRDGRLNGVLEKMGYKSEEDLYLDIGFGKRATREVLEILHPGGDDAATQRMGAFEKFFRSPFRKKSDTGVLVGGMRDIMIHFAQCCNPVAGEEIAGFISQGKGVTIHRVGCQHVEALDPDRRIEVQWDGRSEYRAPVSLRIISANKPGLLAKFTNLFARKSINLDKVTANPIMDDKTATFFEFHVNHIEVLNTLVRDIKRIGGVISVERL